MRLRLELDISLYFMYNTHRLCLLCLDVVAWTKGLYTMEGGNTNMKRKSIFRISLALSLFLIGLLLSGVTMASGSTLRITIDPRTGPPGTAISVTGEGAQTDKLVKVVFVTSSAGGTSLAEVEVTPQADGTFTTTITVPAGTEGGTYAVRAEQTNPATGNLIHYWWNSFTVTGASAATPEAPAPVVPAVSATATVTAPVVPTVSATTAVTATAPATPGEMPTTGTEDSKPDNTLVIVIAILATLGILAALGVGLRQARKA